MSMPVKSTQFGTRKAYFSLFVTTKHFYTLQPGSSCITSLIEGEAQPKHVALIEIKNTDFRVKPIPIPNVDLPFLSLLDATAPIQTDHARRQLRARPRGT